MRNITGKGALMVLIPLFAVLFILWMFVSAAYTPSPEEMRYPTGRLEDSIFVGQNHIYERNPEFKKTFEFSTVPYKIDLIECSGAKVGSGTVFQLSNDKFAYFSEYEDPHTIHEIIGAQFPAVLMLNYIPEETTEKTLVDKYGFINGFSAEYIVDYIKVTDGKESANAVVMGYVLDVPDDGFGGSHMFVSIGTTDYDNDDAQECEILLDAIVRTVRMDSSLAHTLLNKKKYAEGEVFETNVDGTVTNIPIVTRDDFDEMELTVNWTAGNADAILELFLPDGQSYCEPVDQTGIYARFVLDNAKAGVYNLRIQNYKGCGDISTTITPHVRQGQQ